METKKIRVVILNFDQVDQEEYKTIPYVQEFSLDSTLDDVLKWIKTINPRKSLIHAYFNDIEL